MTNQIAEYFEVSATFITELTEDGTYATFMVNGAWFSASLSKGGKIKTNSIRRG